MDGAQTTWRETLRALGGSYRLALRRMALTKSMLGNLFLFLVPVLVALLVTLHRRRPMTIEFSRMIFEQMLRMLYLHFVIFFSANVVGFSIMRQDNEEQTLHYLLLQPISRRVIIAGRLLAFLTLSTLLCAASLWVTYGIFTVRAGGITGLVNDVVGQGRWLTLCAETGVLALGLLIYCTFAMLMASFIKTAFYAILLLGWEMALPYLPSSLKYFTATHYLHSLLTNPPPGRNQLFELLGPPASVLMSLTALGAASLVFYLVAGWLFSQRQCTYGEP